MQGPEADGLQNELIKLLAEARQSVGRESNVEQESGEGMNALATDGIQDKVQITDDKEDQSVNPLAESFRDNQNINNKCPCSCKSLVTELEGIKLDIVILQSQLGIENSKSKDAYEQISKLKLELKKEQHINAMLQDRVMRVEEERDFLCLALKFLMQDQSVNNATPSAVDSGNCWKTVKRAKSRIEYQSNPSLNNKAGNKSELNTTEREMQSSNEKANGNGSGGEPMCTWCQNNCSVLEDLNESCKIIDDIQAKSRVDRNESDKAKTKSKSHTKQQKNNNSGRFNCQGLAAT